ncbi:hypothetical protein [Caryophanon latum]|mgnify:FL=1|nr:hypothetical protein [Caryophanon latum]
MVELILNHEQLFEKEIPAKEVLRSINARLNFSINEIPTITWIE